MTFGQLPNFAISIEKQGPTTINKASFPLRYGKYSEIKTPDYEFRFNLNGEIKFIRGLNINWGHPAEQLKRTDGNDWVYYTVGDKGGENGIISWLGEYYMPCLPYPSNSIWEVNYFENPNTMNAFAAWSQLYADLYGAMHVGGLHPKAQKLVEQILSSNDKVLDDKAKKLNEIIGQRVSVLPPDTRHVDYEVIPLTIADGCLYHCDFCCVKSTQQFRRRSKKSIDGQIQQLIDLYGRNLANYNALFLGNHDALAAGDELINFAASRACKEFRLSERVKPYLFLFGSVDSLLKSESNLFENLNRLPFYTYINIGFESADKTTLSTIGKPINESEVRDAFTEMLDINNTFTNVEITGNFLLSEKFSEEHDQSLIHLLRNTSVPSHSKGAIYLSAIKDSPKKRELLPKFLGMKLQSQLPLFTYIIQRL